MVLYRLRYLDKVSKTLLMDYRSVFYKTQLYKTRSTNRHLKAHYYSYSRLVKYYLTAQSI